jgi:hypothetical protein
MSRPWWWFPSIGLFIVLIVYILYNAFYVAENLSEVDSHSSVDRQCNWKTGDPVVYNLKTKMGVNYDAGHWFHMSENFMTQHSILREKHSLTNASIVYYNFDKGMSLICMWCNSFFQCQFYSWIYRQFERYYPFDGLFGDDITFISHTKTELCIYGGRKASFARSERRYCSNRTVNDNK